MRPIYYYLLLATSLMSIGGAGVVLWKNRYQFAGWLFASTMFILGLWAAAFAQYFSPLEEGRALLWAYITLTFSLLNLPFYTHTMIALVGQGRRMRWVTASCYLTGAAMLAALWHGDIIAGLKSTPHLHHYYQCAPAGNAALWIYEFLWPTVGLSVLYFYTRRAVGYHRTQLLYFFIASLTVFLTTTSVIVPIQSDFYIHPFGLFILPVSMAFLTYAMAKARLADFNVVIARVILHMLTLTVVVGISLVFVLGMTLLAPGFMNQEQILFTVVLVTAIGLTLVATLPRWLPRAERMVQEKFFSGRYGYQDALGGLVKDLSRLPNLDLLVWTVANTIHTQMQVSRVLIFLQDTLSGDYRMIAQSGLNTTEASEVRDLREHSSIPRWLHEAKDVLSRDELPRLVPVAVLREIEAELKPLKVKVCVPMILEDRLVGTMAVGEKLNKDMFFVSDLKLLETLAAEVAMAVKYRRMEEEMFHKNKLAELGAIAAGVAHEIRNPLSSIRTFAQLLPHRVDDPEFKYEFSKTVIKDVERITKVVESMLTFARPSKVTIGDYPAFELVEESILLVQPRLTNKRIKLTKHYHEQPVLKVDKQQIVQVLVNLLNNAIDVLMEDGKIHVAVGIETVRTDTNDGTEKVAVIEVADNGPGIPTAIRTRLFDPFFTTKKEGTGLGLSISQKILRDHGGVITVSSVEGKGASFQIRLPLHSRIVAET